MLLEVFGLGLIQQLTLTLEAFVPSHPCMDHAGR
jgi:hypothetical protein